MSEKQESVSVAFPFQIGDVVQLKSGSPPMTVYYVEPDGPHGITTVGVCFWHSVSSFGDDGFIEKESLDARVLKRFERIKEADF